MTRTSFISTIAILASLAVGGITARSWLEAHDARLQMQATLNAQHQLIVAAQQREQQRATELKDTLAQIAELKRQVQTPQQIIRDLPQYLALPQPIELAPPGSVQVPFAVGTPAQQGSGARAAAPGPANLPDARAPARANAPAQSKASTSDNSNAPPASKVNAPASGGVSVPVQSGANAAPAVELPVADLKPLYDFVQDCRACKAQLDAARADLTDERARSAALIKERDAAIKAAKGSFWSRLARNAKWFAIGTGVGFVLSRAAH
jgi:hypothetical protein